MLCQIIDVSGACYSKRCEPSRQARDPHRADRQQASKSNTSRFETPVSCRLFFSTASEVKARLGGVHGCTHLTELIGVLATTAMQAIFALLRTERGSRPSADEQGPMPMPTLVNSCHTHRIDGEAIRVHWPEPGAPSRASRLDRAPPSEGAYSRALTTEAARTNRPVAPPCSGQAFPAVARFGASAVSEAIARADAGAIGVGVRLAHAVPVRIKATDRTH